MTEKESIRADICQNINNTIEGRSLETLQKLSELHRKFSRGEAMTKTEYYILSVINRMLYIMTDEQISGIKALTDGMLRIIHE